MRIVDFRVRPPVGTFPKVDIFPPIGQERSKNWGWHSALPPSVRARSLNIFRQEMRDCGVVGGVIWGRKSLTPEESISEIELADTVEQHKDLFLGAFGGVSITNGFRGAVEDAEACRKLNLSGVAIEPGWAGLPGIRADDARLYPIYDLCEKGNLIAAFTISAHVGDELSYSDPEAVDRIAADFPRLRIVVSHAFWPYVEESCGMAFRRPNVYLLPDLYGWSSAGHMKWVEAANTFLGSRMLFGSSYPLMGVADVVDAYKRLPYRKGVLERVLYSNACELLGVEQ